MNPQRTPDPAQWIKATKSAGDNACVEMRRFGADIEVRDTKQNGGGPTLRISPEGLRAWLRGAKYGDLDRLLD